MLKKLIAYQKLLLNSTPSIVPTTLPLLTIFLYIFAFVMVVFMNISLFFGNTMSSNTFIPFTLPIITLWMINWIFHGDRKLFKVVPVSRKYTLINIFLLPIVIILILYILVCISGTVLIGIIMGVAYLIAPQEFNQSPSEYALQQITDTTRGNLLMLCVLVIIVFVGTAITLIKRKNLRLLSFSLFATIGYSLLIFLKHTMPISPATGQVEFLESFSIMPQANTILICVAIATVIIIITSIFMGFKLYVGKSTSGKSC